MDPAALDLLLGCHVNKVLSRLFVLFPQRPVHLANMYDVAPIDVSHSILVRFSAKTQAVWSITFFNHPGDKHLTICRWDYYSPPC